MTPGNQNPSRTAWRTSTHSNNGGACIEVASRPGTIAVRDSHNPAGPALASIPAAWTAFTAAIKG